MRVEVSEYDPQWPEQFETIKQELKLALDKVPYEGIEHVGSTSVPGLAAKPTIDIDIIVTADQLEAVVDAITKDSKYYCAGDQGIPDRYAIRPNDLSVSPPRNIYVCLHGCQSLRNHLAIRDVCRANEVVRDNYGQLKLELSSREWENVDEYCQAKTQVLTWILGQSDFSQDELNAIALANGVTL